MSPGWRRFGKLSRMERVMFFRGILLLPATSFAIRLVGLRSVERWLDFPCKANSEMAKTAEEKNSVTETAWRMTQAASRYGALRGNCLSKSLVLWHLLRRQGLNARLYVGGRRDGTPFEAHAWVEMDGRVINDSADVRQRFAPFESHPSTVMVSTRSGK